MTLISHVIVALTLAKVYKISYAPTTIGSIFPDILDAYVLKFSSHRKYFHDLSILIFSVVFLLLPLKIPFIFRDFLIGYASHIFLDGITVSGVYFFPVKKFVKLLPFLKIKTRTLSEFFAVIVICLFIKLSSYLYFYQKTLPDIEILYKNKIIDKKEYLEYKKDRFL